MTCRSPPSMTTVSRVPSLSTGGGPVEVRSLKNFRTSAMSAPSRIGAKNAWCGCLPVLSKSTVLLPARSPETLKEKSSASTRAGAFGSSTSCAGAVTSKRATAAGATEVLRDVVAARGQRLQRPARGAGPCEADAARGAQPGRLRMADAQRLLDGVVAFDAPQLRLVRRGPLVAQGDLDEAAAHGAGRRVAHVARAAVVDDDPHALRGGRRRAQRVALHRPARRRGRLRRRELRRRRRDLHVLAAGGQQRRRWPRPRRRSVAEQQSAWRYCTRLGGVRSSAGERRSIQRTLRGGKM